MADRTASTGSAVWRSPPRPRGSNSSSVALCWRPRPACRPGRSTPSRWWRMRRSWWTPSAVWAACATPTTARPMLVSSPRHSNVAPPAPAPSSSTTLPSPPSRRHVTGYGRSAPTMRGPRRTTWRSAVASGDRRWLLLSASSYPWCQWLIPMCSRLGPPTTSTAPFVRWPEHHVYARDHGDCLGLGTCDHVPLPIAIDHLGIDAERPWPAELFDPAVDRALELLPASQRFAVDKRRNGLFSMTPDNPAVARPNRRRRGVVVGRSPVGHPRRRRGPRSGRADDQHARQHRWPRDPATRPVRRPAAGRAHRSCSTHVPRHLRHGLTYQGSAAERRAHCSTAACRASSTSGWRVSRITVSTRAAFHASKRSTMRSSGPTSATSSISASGTALAASSLWPSR